jgi:uncharacterized protein YggT (Ycf19 family)
VFEFEKFVSVICWNISNYWNSTIFLFLAPLTHPWLKPADSISPFSIQGNGVEVNCKIKQS